ncbi:unnamed protein product, partial [Rotaria sp. Silwood2]
MYPSKFSICKCSFINDIGILKLSISVISSKLSKQNFNSSRFTKIGNSNDKSVKDCKQVVNIFIFGIRKFPSPTNPIILCEHSK